MGQGVRSELTASSLDRLLSGLDHLRSGRGQRLVPCVRSGHLRSPGGSLPQAQLVVVERCGHMLTMEQPGRVNEALAGWLAALFRPAVA